MLTQEDLEPPTGGWAKIEPEGGGTRRWSNAVGDLFSLDFFSIPPDLPSAARDIEPIRSLYRAQLGDQGGIVEIEPIEVDSVPAVRAIFKFPQSPSGMTYLGAVTIPFRSCSYVLKWQCPERGITGARDAIVFSIVSPAIDQQGEVIGWTEDPYLASHRARCMRNRADDVQWDARFPEHPLSRVRAYLANLDSVQLSERAKREPAFAGAQRA